MARGIIGMVSKKIEETITFITNKKLQFRDSGIYLNSPSDGKLMVSADSGNTDSVEISGAVKQGGVRVGYAATGDGSDYDAGVSDYIVGADTSSSALSVTLQTAAVSAGKVIVVRDEGGNAGTNNITINTEGDANIDGGNSVSISTNNEVKRLYCNGTNWFTW